MALTAFFHGSYSQALTAFFHGSYSQALTAFFHGSYSQCFYSLWGSYSQTLRLLQPGSYSPWSSYSSWHFYSAFFGPSCPPPPTQIWQLTCLKKPCHIWKENSNILTCFLLSVLCLWGVTSRTITFCHMLKNTNQDFQKQAEKNQCWFAYHFKEN